jgi:hypothetical protein
VLGNLNDFIVKSSINLDFKSFEEAAQRGNVFQSGSTNSWLWQWSS